MGELSTIVQLTCVSTAAAVVSSLAERGPGHDEPGRFEVEARWPLPRVDALKSEFAPPIRLEALAGVLRRVLIVRFVMCPYWLSSSLSTKGSEQKRTMHSSYSQHVSGTHSTTSAQQRRSNL